MHVLPTIETEMLGSLGSAVSLKFRSVLWELPCRTSAAEPVTAVSLKFRSVLWELLCRTSAAEPVTSSDFWSRIEAARVEKLHCVAKWSLHFTPVITDFRILICWFFFLFFADLPLCYAACHICSNDVRRCVRICVCRRVSG